MVPLQKHPPPVLSFGAPSPAALRYLPNHLQPPLLAGAVKVYILASASTYGVTNLLQPHVPSLVATGQALRTKGLVVTGMAPGETRIYEIAAHE